jgi:hypothetical protein
LADSFPASDPPSWTLGRERHEVGVTIKTLAKTSEAKAKELEEKSLKEVASDIG